MLYSEFLRLQDDGCPHCSEHVNELLNIVEYAMQVRRDTWLSILGVE